MTDDAFWTWLERRTRERAPLALDELVAQAGGARRCAVVAVDLLEGFCRQGPLASPRIDALVGPTGAFLTRCHGAGIRDFLFPCDAHQKDSPEFQAFPPHCVAGTEESSIVSDLRRLPFSHLFERIDKRSVSSTVETGLATRLQGDGFQKIVCIGDCTDLCLYHLATGLRFLANSSGLPWDIVVPADLVATYDLPLETALQIGAMPHPAGLLHDLFLYHLELNGVTVVASLA
jgi:nicotinamidase-related amidase